MMKKYLIASSPSYMQLRKYMPDFALYRNKEEKNYALYAEEFVQMCKNFKELKYFLHRDYELAAKLGASGVHLTSLQLDEIPKAKDLGLEVIVSTHNEKELKHAEDLGAHYATYSPIFATPNKGEPKGVEHLKAVVANAKIKIFALGGIVSEKELKLLQDTQVYGFASIRYFNA